MWWWSGMRGRWEQQQEGGGKEREKNNIYFFVDKPEVRSFSRRGGGIQRPGQARKGHYCVHPVLKRAS
jgi:hypothetical protein